MSQEVSDMESVGLLLDVADTAPVDTYVNVVVTAALRATVARVFRDLGVVDADLEVDAIRRVVGIGLLAACEFRCGQCRAEAMIYRQAGTNPFSFRAYFVGGDNKAAVGIPPGGDTDLLRATMDVRGWVLPFRCDLAANRWLLARHHERRPAPSFVRGAAEEFELDVTVEQAVVTSGVGGVTVTFPRLHKNLICPVCVERLCATTAVVYNEGDNSLRWTCPRQKETVPRLPSRGSESAAVFFPDRVDPAATPDGRPFTGHSLCVVLQSCDAKLLREAHGALAAAIERELAPAEREMCLATLRDLTGLEPAASRSRHCLAFLLRAVLDEVLACGPPLNLARMLAYGESQDHLGVLGMPLLSLNTVSMVRRVARVQLEVRGTEQEDEVMQHVYTAVEALNDNFCLSLGKLAELVSQHFASRLMKGKNKETPIVDRPLSKIVVDVMLDAMVRGDLHLDAVMPDAVRRPMLTNFMLRDLGRATMAVTRTFVMDEHPVVELCHLVYRLAGRWNFFMTGHTTGSESQVAPDDLLAMCHVVSAITTNAVIVEQFDTRDLQRFESVDQFVVAWIRFCFEYMGSCHTAGRNGFTVWVKAKDHGTTCLSRLYESPFATLAEAAHVLHRLVLHDVASQRGLYTTLEPHLRSAATFTSRFAKHAKEIDRVVLDRQACPLRKRDFAWRRIGNFLFNVNTLALVEADDPDCAEIVSYGGKNIDPSPWAVALVREMREQICKDRDRTAARFVALVEKIVLECKRHNTVFYRWLAYHGYGETAASRRRCIGTVVQNAQAGGGGDDQPQGIKTYLPTCGCVLLAEGRWHAAPGQFVDQSDEGLWETDPDWDRRQFLPRGIVPLLPYPATDRILTIVEPLGGSGKSTFVEQLRTFEEPFSIDSIPLHTSHGYDFATLRTCRAILLNEVNFQLDAPPSKLIETIIKQSASAQNITAEVRQPIVGTPQKEKEPVICPPIIAEGNSVRPLSLTGKCKGSYDSMWSRIALLVPMNPKSFRNAGQSATIAMCYKAEMADRLILACAIWNGYTACGLNVEDQANHRALAMESVRMAVAKAGYHHFLCEFVERGGREAQGDFEATEWKQLQESIEKAGLPFATDGAGTAFPLAPWTVSTAPVNLKAELLDFLRPTASTTTFFRGGPGREDRARPSTRVAAPARPPREPSPQPSDVGSVDSRESRSGGANLWARAEVADTMAILKLEVLFAVELNAPGCTSRRAAFLRNYTHDDTVAWPERKPGVVEISLLAYSCWEWRRRTNPGVQPNNSVHIAFGSYMKGVMAWTQHKRADSANKEHRRDLRFYVQDTAQVTNEIRLRELADKLVWWFTTQTEEDTTGTSVPRVCSQFNYAMYDADRLDLLLVPSQLILVVSNDGRMHGILDELDTAPGAPTVFWVRRRIRREIRVPAGHQQEGDALSVLEFEEPVAEGEPSEVDLPSESPSRRRRIE